MMTVEQLRKLKREVIDWCGYECELLDYRLGPRAGTIPVAPRSINPTRRAPKLRTFIRGNARMT